MGDIRQPSLGLTSPRQNASPSSSSPKLNGNSNAHANSTPKADPRSSAYPIASPTAPRNCQTQRHPHLTTGPSPTSTNQMSHTSPSHDPSVSNHTQDLNNTGPGNSDAFFERLHSHLAETAPTSLPIKLGKTHRAPQSLPNSPTNRSTVAETMPSSFPEGCSHDSSSPYAYSVSSSNIILPKGTIGSLVEKPASPSLQPRSVSTPAEMKGSQSALSITFESGPTKSEKIRKQRKMNSSLSSPPPPPSSVASVPMTEGELAVAKLVTDRWPDALYQGWMKKRNKGKESTTKKRYLVLKTHCIEYYSDPMSPTPKGIILLDDIAVKFNEDLYVYTKEKIWEFEAESERDLTRWHVAWRAVLCSINK